VDDRDPKRAADIANAFVEQLRNYQIRLLLQKQPRGDFSLNCN
jgi:hypothetical protein